MTKVKLYLIVLIASLAGQIWLVYQYQTGLAEPENNIPACLFKYATDLPCPSCGTTRSVLHLLHGDLSGALYWNPLGILTLVAMILFPLWILYDISSKKDHFFQFYRRFEITLKNKWVAGPVIFLVVLNWLWNLSKGL